MILSPIKGFFRGLFLLTSWDAVSLAENLQLFICKILVHFTCGSIIFEKFSTLVFEKAWTFCFLRFLCRCILFVIGQFVQSLFVIGHFSGSILFSSAFMPFMFVLLSAIWAFALQKSRWLPQGGCVQLWPLGYPHHGVGGWSWWRVVVCSRLHRASLFDVVARK